MELYFIILIVIVALGFDFMNGFHDAANSIATIVATKALSPFQAVLWAATFNFIAPFVVGVKVADTVGKIVKEEAFRAIPGEIQHILFAALIGAILWEVITWLLGLSVSASHACIGS